MPNKQRNVWDYLAPVYRLAMRPSCPLYAAICQKIIPKVKDKTVLELGAGPGIIALEVASATRRMIATDSSRQMIAEAKKKKASDNLRFQVADARTLPYADEQFDVVIIANTLHIMPDTHLALTEIARILKRDGLLIAPNFVRENLRFLAKLRYRLCQLLGIGFQHVWTAQEYMDFLQEHGFYTQISELLPSVIPVLYIEASRKAQN
ncbi:MAG: class I SAM-dependent methyltransferase [Christensenellales bacterium]